MKKKTKKIKDGYNVSMVYWTDAAEDDKPYEAVTIGVITKLNKKQVTIVGEWFIDGDRRNISTIPRGMVKKIITFKQIAPTITEVFDLAKDDDEDDRPISTLHNKKLSRVI